MLRIQRVREVSHLPRHRSSQVRSLMLSLLLTANLAGCQGPDPAQTVDRFLTAVSDGRVEDAISYICESMVVPEVDELLQNLPVDFTYSVDTSDSNEEIAHVRVTGQIQFRLGPLVGKKVVDGSLTLSSTETAWCIQRDSLGTFVTDLLNTE